MLCYTNSSGVKLCFLSLCHYCTAAGVRGHLHREEKSGEGGAGICRQSLLLHLRARDVPQVDRVWLQEIFHQLLVLARLSDRGCEWMFFFFYLVCFCCVTRKDAVGRKSHAESSG